MVRLTLLFQISAHFRRFKMDVFLYRLREKYHPDFINETREQISKIIRHRLDIFLDLFDKGMIDNQPVELENSKNLKKLMDAVVLKLNGGNDDDLVLLEKSEEANDGGQSSSVKVTVGSFHYNDPI